MKLDMFKDIVLGTDDTVTVNAMELQDYIKHKSSLEYEVNLLRNRVLELEETNRKCNKKINLLEKETDILNNNYISKDVLNYEVSKLEQHNEFLTNLLDKLNSERYDKKLTADLYIDLKG